MHFVHANSMCDHLRRSTSDQSQVEKHFHCLYYHLEVLVGFVNGGNLIWSQSQPVASSNSERTDSALKYVCRGMCSH